MRWFEEKNDHFWIGLFAFAIVLNLFAIYNSDLGLDVHVKSAYVEGGEGYVLDWGDTRQSDPDASNPEQATIINSPPLISNPIASLLFLVLIFIGLSRLNKNIPLIGLILLHPTVIFSSGKSYDELMVLSIFGMGALMLTNAYRNSGNMKIMLGHKLIAYSIMISAIMFKLNFDHWAELYCLGLLLLRFLLFTYLNLIQIQESCWLVVFYLEL